MTEEQRFQAQLVRALEAALPHGWLVTGIANNPRSRTAGAIQKGMGVKAGLPDILVFGRSRLGCDPMVYAIECKSKTGRLSPVQRDMHDRLKDIGIPIVVARTWDDVRSFGDQWQWPWRLAA